MLVYSGLFGVIVWRLPKARFGSVVSLELLASRQLWQLQLALKALQSLSYSIAFIRVCFKPFRESILALLPPPIKCQPRKLTCRNNLTHVS
jgi:hypothetical protein